MAKFRKTRFSLIAFNVLLLCITSVTAIYAAFTYQRTAEQTFTINNLGTVTCTVALSSGNVFLANASGAKTTTTAKLFPGGRFAVPLSITYTGSLPNGGVICKTGSGSASITGYTVQVGGSSYSLSNTNTTISKVFILAEIRCSGSTTITSTANTNYYLLLGVRSPSEGNALDAYTAQNFFTNAITAATITFSMTLYTNTTS